MFIFTDSCPLLKISVSASSFASSISARLIDGFPPLILHGITTLFPFLEIVKT